MELFHQIIEQNNLYENSDISHLSQTDKSKLQSSLVWFYMFLSYSSLMLLVLWWKIYKCSKMLNLIMVLLTKIINCIWNVKKLLVSKRSYWILFRYYSSHYFYFRFMKENYKIMLNLYNSFLKFFMRISLCFNSVLQSCWRRTRTCRKACSKKWQFMWNYVVWR